MSANFPSVKPATKGGPKTADIDIGIRLRLRRSELNMSQQTLGDQLGVSFQQVQKYERGINRISGSSLQKLTTILGVPSEYFLAPLILTHPEPAAGGFSETTQATLADAPTGTPLDPAIFQRSETYDLLRAYYTIAEPQQRRKVLDTVKAMASMVAETK